VTRSKAVGRCHAFSPHPLAGAPPCRHWPPYSGHAATHTVASLNLVPKLSPQPPRVGHKSPPPFFTRVNTKPAAVRHRCRLGELPASCVNDAVGLRLTPLLTHLEPTRAQVALAELPARRSTSSPTAAEQPPASPTPRLSSEPINPSRTSTRSHGSYPCRTLLSPAPILTGIRASAGAPPLLRRHRSPVTSPADPPLPIERG
jgi:hypothetical protein